MPEQHKIDYQRIETAIRYISDHFKDQPSLDDIAQIVHVSPYHFQKMFTEWAGVSPKKFMQYLSLNHAKALLRKRKSLQDTALETGLSGTGRLHDLFINIEGMTPGEFKNGGAKLQINYSFSHTLFGSIIVASTSKGICHLHFENNEMTALRNLQSRFPNAVFIQAEDHYQLEALSLFQKNWHNLKEIKLHLVGTPFQIKVWESLLHIPLGSLATYGDIAESINKPKSARAVGSAIGRNPIAFLIPCHRVIQSSGNLGGYMWGIDRKKALIGWESAQINIHDDTIG
tara:strand:- start:1926 stop:2783 length:858 start_codon:yes stop_codon:yes gene_type:complete